MDDETAAMIDDEAEPMMDDEAEPMMDDEVAALIFAKALGMLLEPDQGIIVHVQGKTAVLVFKDGDAEIITCCAPDSNLLEIPDGTLVPVMKHEIPKEDLANFVLPETGKMH